VCFWRLYEEEEGRPGRAASQQPGTTDIRIAGFAKNRSLLFFAAPGTGTGSHCLLRIQFYSSFLWLFLCSTIIILIADMSAYEEVNSNSFGGSAASEDDDGYLFGGGSSTYSYVPMDLVAAFNRLVQKEEELIERSAKEDSVVDDAVMAPISENGDGKSRLRESSSPSLSQSAAEGDGRSSSARGGGRQQQELLVVAAVQLSGAGLPNSDVAGYCFRAEQAIEQAVAAARNGNDDDDGGGARCCRLILLPELWSGPYFCQSQEAGLMDLALPLENNVLIKRMQLLAKLYNVVLPVR